MPIITNEQIKTGIIVLLFFAGGLVVHILLMKWEDFRQFPDNLWQKDQVAIRLRGAVQEPQIRKVPKEWTLWQAIVHENSMSYYIQWGKIALAQRVYEGLDLKVPFRKLRSGEKISWKELTKSKGKLILTLPCPCIEQDTTKWARMLYENDFPRWEIIEGHIKRKENIKCVSKYIDYN